VGRFATSIDHLDHASAAEASLLAGSCTMAILLPGAVFQNGACNAPARALIDSGAAARVYVERSEGVFEPRQVETGWRYDERVEILRGVHAGERVVIAATFLVDSESRLKTPAASPAPARTMDAPSRMPAPVASAKTVKDPNCGMPVDPASAAAAGNTFAYRGVTYYFCSSQCKQTFQNDPAGSARRQGD